MAAGLPVIVSDQVGIHREISANGAGLVVRCSERELADALDRMIKEPALRAEAGGNGPKLAERFSVKSVTSQLVDVYDDVIPGRNGTTGLACANRAV
jgi:glycosyltransferase involved in cell wall biosynthesis